MAIIFVILLLIYFIFEVCFGYQASVFIFIILIIISFNFHSLSHLNLKSLFFVIIIYSELTITYLRCQICLKHQIMHNDSFNYSQGDLYSQIDLLHSNQGQTIRLTLILDLHIFYPLFFLFGFLAIFGLFALFVLILFYF